MSTSYVTYSGTGTQTDFTFPFNYLDKTDVFVFVNGVSSTYSWLNSSSIRTTTAPATGTAVQIRRSTQTAVTPVNFTDGSVLLETDLDTLALYSLYQAQEAADLDDRLANLENLVLGLGDGGLPGMVSVQRLSGTGGQTVFTLGIAPASSNNTDVYLDGLYQNHNTFTVVGSALTFSEAPRAGVDNIEVQIMVALGLTGGGANLITYTPAGTGAVATTVQTKLRGSVSIDDFGADPTGVADSAAAILAAATSGAIKATAKASGTYSVSTVALPSNFELDFCDATVNARTASVKVFTNSAYFSGSNTNITIRNVTINGNKGSLASVIGIGIQNTTGINLYNVKVSNCGGNGIFVGTTSANVTLRDVVASSNGDNGTNSFNSANINILGGTADYPNAIRVKNVSAINCVAYSAWGIGFISQFVDNLSVVGGEYSYNGRGYSSPTINGNGVGGGQVFSGKFMGLSTHNNIESGFDIASKSRDISIVGCSSFDNGVTGIFAGHTNGDGYSIIGNSVATNGGMGIWVTDTARSVVISGNYVQANGSRGIFVESTQYVTVSDNIVKDHLSGFGNGIMMSDLYGTVDGGTIVGNMLVNNILNLYNPYNAIIQQSNSGGSDNTRTIYNSANYNALTTDRVIISSGSGSIQTIPNPTKYNQGASYKFVNTSAGSINISSTTNGIWVAGSSVTTDTLVTHATANYLCVEISSGVFQWVRN